MSGNISIINLIIKEMRTLSTNMMFDSVVLKQNMSAIRRFSTKILRFNIAIVCISSVMNEYISVMNGLILVI
jgi:hypothetical protein